MRIDAEPWMPQGPDRHGHRLVLVPLDVLEALSVGDLPEAARRTNLPLSPYLVADECRSTWLMRVAQLTNHPGDGVWVTRILVAGDSAQIVGRAGFHGPPDARGMVEVGYSIDPLHRRKGHARAALEIMVQMAKADPRVTVVRASVRPDNLPSRALVDSYGFVEVGEQWDDVDGLETLLELAV